MAADDGDGDGDGDTTASVEPSATLDADEVDVDVRSPSRDCCTAAGAAAWRGTVGNAEWSA